MAITEAALKEWKEAIVLFAVILMNIVIGFSQEYKAKQALEALMSLSVPKAVVVRDGQTVSIDSMDLVPGDIVVLEEGDAVPADLRIAEASQLEIVEALLTGESLPVAKFPKHIRAPTRKLPLGDCKGNAFMSTVVAKGRGKGIVVRTGHNTEIGKISAAITSQPSVKTPIQQRLNRLGLYLVIVSVVACVLMVVIGVAWGNNAGEMVKIGISLAVSVIPEGLVAVVTVTMAIGVSRMASQNAIVRKLPSVETLGSVTVICSDKTGTLTEGKMGLAQLHTVDASKYVFTRSTELDPTVGGVEAVRANQNRTFENGNGAANGGVTEGSAKAESISEPVAKEAARAPPQLLAAMMVCCLCNNAAVTKTEDEGWKPTGDPTEVALVVAAEKSGFGKDFWLSQVGLVKMGEFAFDSDRKIMSSVYEAGRQGTLPFQDFSSALILAKGAPEGVLSRCVSYLPDGPLNEVTISKAAPLDDEIIARITEQSAGMAGNGLRVLGLAIRLVDLETSKSILESGDSERSETELCFVGLVGLIDPPKYVQYSSRQ